MAVHVWILKDLIYYMTACKWGLTFGTSFMCFWFEYKNIKRITGQCCLPHRSEQWQLDHFTSSHSAWLCLWIEIQGHLLQGSALSECCYGFFLCSLEFPVHQFWLIPLIMAPQKASGSVFSAPSHEEAGGSSSVSLWLAPWGWAWFSSFPCGFCRACSGMSVYGTMPWKLVNSHTCFTFLGLLAPVCSPACSWPSLLHKHVLLTHHKFFPSRTHMSVSAMPFLLGQPQPFLVQGLSYTGCCVCFCLL